MEKENSKKTLVDVKTDLICSEDFDKLLDQAVSIKKEIQTSCKDRDRQNYSRFYELMLLSRNDISDILDKRNKDRTDDEKKRLKEFKKQMSKTYKTVCDLLVPEDLEEGEESKVSKMVSKIGLVVKLMDFLGNHVLEEEFKKYGIELKFEKLNQNPVFQNENVERDVKDTMECGKSLKKEVDDNKNSILDSIYPNINTDLIYDKDTNPVGIKTGDFNKLVDLKLKVVMAKDEDQKGKVEEQVENIASDKTFENARNEVMQRKLQDLVPPECKNEGETSLGMEI